MPKPPTQTAAIEILPPERATKPATKNEEPGTKNNPLAKAIAHHQSAAAHAAGAAAHAILAGHDLIEQQRALGFTRGHAAQMRLGAKEKAPDPGKPWTTWEECLAECWPGHVSTAYSYTKLAKAAKAAVPAIAEALAAGSPDLLALVAPHVQGKTITDCVGEWLGTKAPGLQIEGGKDDSPPRITKHDTAWSLVGVPVKHLAQAQANPTAFAKAWHHLTLEELQTILDTLTAARDCAEQAWKLKSAKKVKGKKG